MFNLINVWRDIAIGARLGRGARRADPPPADEPTLRRRIEEAIEDRGGAVSARARAAEVGQIYLQLAPEGHRRFLEILARDFGVDREAVAAAIAAYQAAGDEPVAAAAAEDGLCRALTSRRTQLLSRLTSLPDGFKFLVDLRADLLEHLERDPALVGLENDMARLLSSWFDVGLLTVQQITWSSPAMLLEKLIAYEAVHTIRSWDDLKNRLESDRRCFAFFHPRMPDEPLIFIEVALVNGLSGNIQALLDESAPQIDAQRADTAIFYSISSTQKGLRGITLGDFLIKRVVDLLSAELPNLKTFATLSPIPGFRRWLERRLAEGEAALLTAVERERLAELGAGLDGDGSLGAILERSDWHQNPIITAAVERPLTRLCAQYLIAEKRNGRPIDPVARFHLANGARVQRLNWLGDTSPNGLRQSAGLMVNYLYKLSDIEKNHEAFSAGRVVAAPAVQGLLKA